LIARSGLREADAAYARLALDAFKEEFVSMEADAVKNQYVRALGLRAILMSVMFLILWMACITWFAAFSISANAAPFLLAAIGACAGTWLSFAIRRVVLGFNDLALIEEDRMAPLSRIVFVVGLTLLVGLFLESGVVNAEINGIRMDLGNSDLVALLIGAMCGISERALAGAIGSRSADFVTRFATIPSPKGPLPSAEASRGGS
jgi:hypothetical protein